MPTNTLRTLELPPMPQVAARVMQIDESQVSVSAEQIKNIIQADMALSTKLLKLANSAFYARGHRIQNLAQAIALLGFKTVKGLSLLVSAASIIPKKGNFKIMKELWMRAVLTALVSKIIAEKVGKDKIKDEVFMVGLLRQIGKSMLANQYPEEYAICYDMAEEGVDEEKLHQLEKMKWGITSADASHVAMQTWNFPESLLNSSQVLRYNITNLEQLEKEQPHLLPVVIAEYIVLLGNYTNTIKLSEKLKSKLMDQVGKLSIIYGIDEEKQRFYLDELRREIREDSFYSFCGELFTN